MFPFSRVRPIQVNFMNDVSEALSSGKHLIAHAPTGIGKTAAALAPALEYALENGKTVFFLTPKHAQHHIAVDTLRQMKKKRHFVSTDLIGKKWLCSVAGIDELTSGDFNEYCRSVTKEERCSYYKNTRNKHYALSQSGFKILNNLKQKQPLHAEEAKELCSAEFCTYELLTELAKQSNIIIADYYHVFSPLGTGFLARLRKDIEQSIIIVDEAHNLPQRIRSFMTQKLTTFSVRKAEKEARIFGFHDMTSDIRAVGNALNSLKTNEREIFMPKNIFIDELKGWIDDTDAFISDLFSAAKEVQNERKKSSMGSIARFLEAWHGDDIGFARILTCSKTRSGRDYLSLAYSCMDPMLFTKEIIAGSYSTILMSGTLMPVEMYADLLGFDMSRTMLRSYNSPFPRANRMNLLVSGITTRYSQRTEENFIKIASIVEKCSHAVPGNVAVFFPSYAIRDKVHQLIKGNAKKEMIIEQQGSNKAERRQLYNLFVSHADRGAILLGVQAGSFSEGIDLPGTCLNGVIIVGIPLERPDLMTKSLIDYYDHKFSRGWDYGYIYPAMMRSIQAAGRCIRSESDRGVCVFLDERFAWGNYRKAFPQDIVLKSTTEPENEISEFFRR